MKRRKKENNLGQSLNRLYPLIISWRTLAWTLSWWAAGIHLLFTSNLGLLAAKGKGGGLGEQLIQCIIYTGEIYRKVSYTRFAKESYVSMTCANVQKYSMISKCVILWIVQHICMAKVQHGLVPSDIVQIIGTERGRGGRGELGSATYVRSLLPRFNFN